jgi:hypothetical protein
VEARVNVRTGAALITSEQLSALKKARNALHLSRTAFESVLQRHGGVTVMTDLDQAGLRRVAVALRALADDGVRLPTTARHFRQR